MGGRGHQRHGADQALRVGNEGDADRDAGGPSDAGERGGARGTRRPRSRPKPTAVEGRAGRYRPSPAAPKARPRASRGGFEPESSPTGTWAEAEHGVGGAWERRRVRAQQPDAEDDGARGDSSRAGARARTPARLLRAALPSPAGKRGVGQPKLPRDRDWWQGSVSRASRPWRSPQSPEPPEPRADAFAAVSGCSRRSVRSRESLCTRAYGRRTGTRGGRARSSRGPTAAETDRRAEQTAERPTTEDQPPRHGRGGARRGGGDGRAHRGAGPAGRRAPPAVLASLGTPGAG